jgi:hypothetical protein
MRRGERERETESRGTEYTKKDDDDETDLSKKRPSPEASTQKRAKTNQTRPSIIIQIKNLLNESKIVSEKRCKIIM